MRQGRRRRRAELSPHLAVPRRYRHVTAYLHDVDPDLRIRASIERIGWYVLERRCRRRPAVNTAMRDNSDIHVQARDGYIHIGIVHPEYLNKPWNIVAALKVEGVDLWPTSADDTADELEYEERFLKETRKRRRSEDAIAHYREEFDVLSRMGSERTRLNNPGLSPAPGSAATAV